MSIRLLDTLQAGFLDGSGQPLSNGTVTVYDAGTTNLRQVFQEYALTTAHANPIVLDGEGKANAYTDRRVKFVIRNSAGATLLTVDNVGSAAADYSSGSAAGLAGDGLIAPGDGTIAINADGITTEVASDALRVKDLGISTAKLADDAVTPAKASKALGPTLASNLSIACSVATSALTIALKSADGGDPEAADPVVIAFRSTTLTSGAYVNRTTTTAKSLVISSGSTLGHTSAEDWPVYVYAIDAEALSGGAGVELAVSTSPLDERYLQTTVAEGGAGAADSNSVLYSTTVRASVAVRLVAILRSTQTTAGTWAAVPASIAAPTQASPISVAPIRPVAATAPVGGVARSTSSGAFGTTSGSFADVTNLSVTLTTRGRPVFVGLVGDGTANLSTLQVDLSAGTTAFADFNILRDATEIARVSVQAVITTSWSGKVPSSSLWQIDPISAGTYTFKVQARAGASTTAGARFCRLVAYEI